MTEITHKSRNKAKTAEITCSPNVFNNYFLSLTDAILKSADTSTSSDCKIPTPLKKFCKDRISSRDSFKVPPIAVHDVGVYINVSLGSESSQSYSTALKPKILLTQILSDQFRFYFVQTT